VTTTTSMPKHAAAQVRVLRKAQAIIAEEVIGILAAFGTPGTHPLLPNLPPLPCTYVNQLTEASEAMERLAKRLAEQQGHILRRGDEFPGDLLYSAKELTELGDPAPRPVR
jgi:hypothetical protein